MLASARSYGSTDAAGPFSSRSKAQPTNAAMLDGVNHQPVPYMERSRLYYEAQGFTRAYTWAQFDDAPFSPMPKPLAESRLVLITTAALV